MDQQLWRSDALTDVQRLINRTLHGTYFYPKNSRRRNFISPESNIQNHPFKVTVSGNTYRITGGYVFGYDESFYVEDGEYELGTGGAFIYLTVEPDSVHRQIKARFSFGSRSYREVGVYNYPLAKISETGEVIQYQVGNLVTPFRRNYFPIIKGSLNSLIKVVEGEGDEVKFWLQERGKTGSDEGVMWTGPGPNQHLCTDKNKELCWEERSDSSCSSSSSSSSSSSPSSSSISGSSSSMIDDLDDLEPGKWYVFVRYYRNEGETQITYQGYLYNTRETFHTEGWGTEIGRWVADEYSMGDDFVYVNGYYFNAVAGGPFNTIDEAGAWWREHEWEYDQNVARPE